MKDTFDLLIDTDFPRIKRAQLETLQVNLGYLCNQQCLHCHVDASPRRKEIMTARTVSDVLEFLKHKDIKTKMWDYFDNGAITLKYAEELGLGSRRYNLIKL